MATTKIWDVKGWLGKVVIYIENPAKTENPAFYQKADMTETQAQRLTDVIEYAVDSNKTEMQYYVSALNCSTLTARNEMMAVKKRYGKEDGIVVFDKANHIHNHFVLNSFSFLDGRRYKGFTHRAAVVQ